MVNLSGSAPCWTTLPLLGLDFLNSSVTVPIPPLRRATSLKLPQFPELEKDCLNAEHMVKPKFLVQVKIKPIKRFCCNVTSGAAGRVTLRLSNSRCQQSAGF